MTTSNAPRGTTPLVPLTDLQPADWNPRIVRTERFLNLVRTIASDPDFLWKRPVLAQGDGTIYAGNQRYKAVERLWQLGTLPGRSESEPEVNWTAVAAAAGIDPGTVPAVVEDVPEQLARERALRDNSNWGEWDDGALAEIMVSLRDDGADLTTLGFGDAELQSLIEGGGLDTDEPGPFADLSDGVETNTTCPKCGYAWSESK